MRLMYLDTEAIDDLKMNFTCYKSHFTDDTNEWFMDKFRKNGWIHESKIQCNDFELNYDNDFNVSDRRNIGVIYEALKELSPANALDERLWAGMLFAQLWKYVKYRRSEALKSGDEREILNSFLFMRGTKRSCFINCLSRLWWTGHLLYDDQKVDHYGAIDLISERAFASNIVLISSNNFVANKSLALGVLDCMIERKQKGERITRDYYVEANKYLSIIGEIHKPKYRRYNEASGVTWQDLSSTVDGYVRLLIEKAGISHDRWGKLLRIAGTLPDELFKCIFITAEKQFIAMDAYDQLQVKNAIRKIVYKHRHYNSASWAMDENKIQKYEKLLNDVAISCPEYEYEYCFDADGLRMILNPIPFENDSLGEKNRELFESNL